MEHPDGTRTPVIDASVHIFCKSNKDLRQNFLREPFRSRGFPDYEMDWYGAPGGEYAKGTTGPDKQYPGSDPDDRRASTCSTSAAWTWRSCTRCAAASCRTGTSGPRSPPGTTR